MDTELSLETILQDLRRKETHRPRFNQHHRQFLDRLRDLDWTSCLKLPEAPRTKLALLRNGWIERRTSVDGVEYRMTDAGLAALNQPR